MSNRYKAWDIPRHAPQVKHWYSKERVATFMTLHCVALCHMNINFITTVLQLRGVKQASLRVETLYSDTHASLKIILT